MIAVSHTLRGEGFDASEDGTGRGIPLVPIAFDCKGTQVHFTADGAHQTLRSMSGINSQSGGGHAAVAFELRGRDGGAMPEGPHDVANLRAASGGSSRSYIALPSVVRRLTPLECERLMGFDDGYTAVPNGSKRTADGPRYKQLGNSWATNCAEWIGRRIQEVDDMRSDAP